MSDETEPAPGPVHVFNEWDPLEEIIVGSARGARLPRYDVSYHVAFCHGAQADEVPSGPISERIIEEAEEDLAEIVKILERAGVTVRRPQETAFEETIATPLWSTEGLFNYCPRDLLLAIGDMIIETPMPMRARYLEALAYRHIMLDYLDGGSRWIAAPRPTLADELFNLDDPERPALLDLEPAFDAANILRLGRDILYLRSNTGNERGARWLQSVLGAEYRVHVLHDLYHPNHIDTTLVPLRPGLVLANPKRVTPDRIPSPMRNWEVIYAAEMVDIGYGGAHGLASAWIGMNFLMLDPETAMVEERQLPLIRQLERHGITVQPIRLRHARTLGGGLHCATLDVRRRGTLESYV